MYCWVHLLEWGVVDSNCMGMIKGTDLVVSSHGCTSASLELVLPSRHHHPVKLLGKCSSVPFSSSSAILVRWQANMSSSGEWSAILGSIEESIIFFIYQAAVHCVKGTRRWVCSSKWQVQMIYFLVSETWNGHGSWHRGVGTLKHSLSTFVFYSLLRKASIWKHHLKW